MFGEYSEAEYAAKGLRPEVTTRLVQRVTALVAEMRGRGGDPVALVGGWSAVELLIGVARRVGLGLIVAHEAPASKVYLAEYAQALTLSDRGGDVIFPPRRPE